jgi:hypothetical protein
MGLLDIIKSVFGKKVEKPSNTTRSYYGSNGNRLRFTPLKYFPKIEEKLLAFKAEFISLIKTGCRGKPLHGFQKSD